MTRWVVVGCLFALTGCDVIFKLQGPAVADAADGAIDGDPGLPPLPRGCSPMKLLADGFDDDNFFPFWTKTETQTNQAVATGGQVQFTFPAVNTTAQIASRAYFDLRDDSFTVEYSQNAGLLASNYVGLELLSEVDGLKLTIETDGTMLFARRYENGQQFAVGQGPYLVNAQLWRISNANDVTKWESSTDSVNFTELGRITGLPVSFVRPVLIAERRSPGVEFSVLFDNVNVVGSDAMTCPADALRDNFAAGTIGLPWALSRQIGCRFDIVGGELVATFTTPGGNDCALAGSTLFDLRGHPFTVQVPSSMLDPLTSQTISVDLTPLRGGTIRFVIQGGELRAENGQGVAYRAAAYDPTLPLWLRIGAVVEPGVSDRVIWSTSSDGITFEEFVSTLDFGTFGLDQVLVAFGISNGGTSAGTATFDNVNLP
jgi:hypothetical protein